MNTTTGFAPLGKEGVLVDTYSEVYKNVTNKTQSQPDVMLNFQNSTYRFQGTAGIDLKSKVSGVGFNKIFPTDTQKYKKVLESYQVQARRDKYLNSDIDKHLEDLKNAYGNIEYMHVWASGLHLYPIGKFPPVAVSNTIQTGLYTPETMEEFKKACNDLDQLSKKLQENRVPENIGHRELKNNPIIKKFLEEID